MAEKEKGKGVRDKVMDMAYKGQAVSRLGHMKILRGKENISKLMDEAKKRVSDGMRNARDGIVNGGKTAAYAAVGGVYMAGQHVSQKIKDLKAKGKAVNRLRHQKMRKFRQKIKSLFSIGKKKQKEPAAKKGNIIDRIKNSKAFKIAKNVAKYTGLIIAGAAILTYKGAKATYKGVKSIGQNLSHRSQVAARAAAIKAASPAKTPQEAEKSANGNLDKLNAGQIKANWSHIGRGESDGRYRMAQKAESVLESVKKGELKLNAENAPQIAAWLEVNRDIQDRINKNRVTEKNDRNEKIAEQLEAFGFKNPNKTKETQEKESQSQTVSNEASDKSAQKTDPLKEIDPETLAKIDKERAALEGVLAMNEKSGRQVNKDEFISTFGQELTNKGKEGYGLSEAQAAAYKAQYPNLFPSEEKEKTAENVGKQQEPVLGRESENKEDKKQEPVLGKESETKEEKAPDGKQQETKPRDTNEMRDSILNNDNENQKRAGAEAQAQESKPKTDWMEKYDVNNNDMFKQRLDAYKVKGLQGSEDTEFKYALGIEKLMTLPEEKGGLGLNPKTPEGKEAIDGLKAQMYEQHGVKSFKPETPKQQANSGQSRGMKPNVAQMAAKSKAAVND